MNPTPSGHKKTPRDVSSGGLQDNNTIPTSSGQDDELVAINGLRCPACGRLSLFVGAGGYVTCGSLECPNPDYESAIARHTQEAEERGALRARLDERHELRKLFDALRMQFGASAGSATGVTVRNDFGEEWSFQLDREALGELLARFNDKSAPHPQQNTTGTEDR